MAFSVTLYENFKKKTNSTKIPDSSVTQRVFQNVEIKEQSSLINPVIKFLFDGSAKFMEYNYAYIPYFNRYYFIDNIVYNGGRYEASLTCDVLASYKTDIGNSTQYVLRSTALQNVDIEDTHYLMSNLVSNEKITITDTPFVSLLENGIYVVGIVNSATNTRGCTSYYTMNNAQFRALSNFLLSDPTYLNISVDEISSALQKALINPMQYITSLVWIPLGNFPVGNSPVKVGWWDATGITGGLLTTNTTISKTFDVQLKKHPQTNTRGDWVNGNRGTQITLLFPPFGKIALDASKITHNNYITISLDIDMITGQGIIKVYGKKNNQSIDDGSYDGLLYYGEMQVGVNMSVNSISQASNFYSMQTLFNVQGFSVGSIINSSNSIFGTNIDPGVGSALIAPNYSALKSGGNGSIAAFEKYPELIFDFFQFVPDFNDDFGRPLCEPHKISDLPGFILCSTNDIEIAGTREEAEKIGSYLTGGFFYE